MKKIDFGECVNCEFCDWNRKDTWCINEKGAHFGDTDYHIADCGCDQWKPCKEYKEEIMKEHEVQKPSYGNGYVENPWSAWKQKAYKKGLYHE